MSNPKFNQSGCKDPTAFEAISHVSHEEKRVTDLMKCLKYIVKSSGFEIQGRIHLKCRKTGKVWK